MGKASWREIAAIAGTPVAIFFCIAAIVGGEGELVLIWACASYILPAYAIRKHVEAGGAEPRWSWRRRGPDPYGPYDPDRHHLPPS